MKILLHIVGGQPSPIYIAARTVQADVNVFAYSDDSKEKLPALKQLIGGTTSEIKIEPWSFSSVVHKMETFLSQYPKDEVILNFTGGTKIASFAALTVFRNHGFNAIYVNTQDNEVINFLYHEGSYREEHTAINIESKVQDLFALQGQKVKINNSDYPERFYALAEEIMNRPKIYNLLRQKFYLKYMSKKYNFKSQRNDMDFVTHTSSKSDIEVLFRNGSTIVRLYSKDTVTFEVKDSGVDLLYYLGGLWFESLVIKKLASLNFFNEVVNNVLILNKAVNSKTDETKNEFDVVGVRGMYPTIFECKSGNVKQEDVNKLIAGKQYLGGYTTLCLITMLPFNDKKPSHRVVLEKMKENHIVNFTYDQLNERTINKLTFQANL